MPSRSLKNQDSERSSSPTKSKSTEAWSGGQLATLSIILEASSCKAGNVFPGVSFSDMHYEDFVRSALAIGPVLDHAGRMGVGKVLYRAVEATQNTVGVNTNLGTLLLLTPLATALHHNRKASGKVLPTTTATQLKNATREVLRQLNKSDSQWVYKAIVLASPGGLGSAENMDVRRSKAPDDLLDAMRAASALDWIARCFANGFEELFLDIAPAMLAEIQHCSDICEGLRRFQVRWLAQHGDSLVVRKLGEHENEQLKRRATTVVETLDAFRGDAKPQKSIAKFEKQWLRLDRWLRAKGNRRNPGTTADLIAAGLFVLLATNQLTYSSSASPVGRAN